MKRLFCFFGFFSVFFCLSASALSRQELEEKTDSLLSRYSKPGVPGAAIGVVLLVNRENASPWETLNEISSWFLKSKT